MNITIKHLPLTEEAYDYLVNYRIKFGSKDGFYQVKDKEEWDAVLADDSLWYSKRYIYVVGDHFYMLSQIKTFASSEWYKKIFKTLVKKGLNKVTYFYIWHYCSTDKKEAENFWNIKKDTSYLNGSIAYKKVCKEIFNHYSDEQVSSIIEEHGVKDDDTKDILHYHMFRNARMKNNVVYKVSNVAYYDLNKAYASNLMKFFPEIKNWLLDGYKKDKPYFKKVVNYAVGCFQNNITYGKHPKHNFHNLRNAIVTDTTTRVNTAIWDLVDGDSTRTMYINTDGLIVRDPNCEIAHSNEIGDFGKEVIDNDEMWCVTVNQAGYKKYTIMQWFENGEKVVKVIGGFRQSEALLEHTDLSKGIVPLFKDIALNVQTSDGTKVTRILDKESIVEVKLDEQKY